MNKPVDRRLGIDNWLDALAERIDRDAPDLRSLFDVYAEEARFGRQFLSDELMRLPHGATVLEVGAGAYLLSCQLVREGFGVTALEPIGDGFSHFHRMQAIVVQLADEMHCLPRIVAFPAEELKERGAFDFAFSINVMEHVRDVGAVISRVADSLRRGASYRFTCPNYAFPYEPHFNMPTLFSKRLTERWMAKRIFNWDKLEDPEGTWSSLNWIDVGQVRRVLRAHPELRFQFDRSALTKALERMVRDPQYAARRPAALRFCIDGLVRTGLHKLASALPPAVLPIIDCRIQKVA